MILEEAETLASEARDNGFSTEIRPPGGSDHGEYSVVVSIPYCWTGKAFYHLNKWWAWLDEYKENRDVD